MLHIIQGKFTRSLWQPIPVRMPTAVFDTADVLASMFDNVAKCMADNAALLRQLHGRAQSGGFPGLASEGALQQAQAAVPLTGEEARQQTQAEKLTLLVAESKTGYFGVTHRAAESNKPYEARVSCGGKQVSLGGFATAEEAALCVARTPEGQAAAAAAAAERAAAAPVPLTSEEARQQARAGELTQLVALLVKEEVWECSEGRPKRQRTM